MVRSDWNSLLGRLVLQEFPLSYNFCELEQLYLVANFKSITNCMIENSDDTAFCAWLPCPLTQSSCRLHPLPNHIGSLDDSRAFLDEVAITSASWCMADSSIRNSISPSAFGHSDPGAPVELKVVERLRDLTWRDLPIT